MKSNNVPKSAWLFHKYRVRSNQIISRKADFTQILHLSGFLARILALSACDDQFFFGGGVSASVITPPTKSRERKEPVGRAVYVRQAVEIRQPLPRVCPDECLDCFSDILRQLKAPPEHLWRCRMAERLLMVDIYSLFSKLALKSA